MTQRYIDDVTGEIIEEGRSYRLQGPGGSYRDGGTIDVKDPEQLLAIVRDQITDKRSSAPFEVLVQTWEHLPLPTAYRKYAPELEPTPAPEPEPEPEPKPARTPFPYAYVDRPYIPLFTRPSVPSVPSSAGLVALANGRVVPERERDELVARIDKARTKFARAGAALCGCGDVDAHERNLP